MEARLRAQTTKVAMHEREGRRVRRRRSLSSKSAKLTSAPKATAEPLDIGGVTSFRPASLGIPSQGAEQWSGRYAEAIVELGERIRFKVPACTTLRAVRFATGRELKQRMNVGLLRIAVQSIEHPESVSPG